MNNEALHMIYKSVINSNASVDEMDERYGEIPITA